MKPSRTTPALALALVLPALAAVPGSAPASDAAEIAAARRSVAAAAFGSVEQLVAVRAEVASAAAAHPTSAALLYWTALADYRLAPRLMSERPKDAERWIEDGVAHLDRALKLDPRFADALALRASLKGLSIGLDPARGMTLGGDIEEDLASARALAPGNPRVALIDGINSYNKPKFVGGGPKPALAKLLEAQRLFATAALPADSVAIDWGHDDAYAWAGRAAEKLGKRDEARNHYRRALEINPGNSWVEHSLLPKLEKAAVSRAKP